MCFMLCCFSYVNCCRSMQCLPARSRYHMPFCLENIHGITNLYDLIGVLETKLFSGNDFCVEILSDTRMKNLQIKMTRRSREFRNFSRGTAITWAWLLHKLKLGAPANPFSVFHSKDEHRQRVA